MFKEKYTRGLCEPFRQRPWYILCSCLVHNTELMICRVIKLYVNKENKPKKLIYTFSHVPEKKIFIIFQQVWGNKIKTAEGFWCVKDDYASVLP